MEPFRYHVFICDQQKPEGAPGCCARGGRETLAALRREIAARGLEDEVQITTCGSLGLCEAGPNLVVYPEGIWYSGVLASDVPRLVEQHFQNGKPLEPLARMDPAGLRAEMLANREKRLAAERARDAAGALPDDLQARIRGFQESRAILTALELDVFTAVGTGATAAQAAATVGADARATETLLNALAAMELMIKEGETFRNTPVSARYFSAASPENARSALMHIAGLWNTWSNLTASVRAGTAAGNVGMTERRAEWTEAFIAAMHRNASERAGAVVRAVGVAGVRRMLDVGGGSGAYSIAFAKASPALTADILDLEAVAPIAQRHIDSAGVGKRVHVRTGDLRTDDLGSGYDLVFLSAVCHMLGPDENRSLLARARNALVPGGYVVIQDFILEPEKTAPKSAALFSLNMLVGTAAGASYSEPEYVEWMQEAGFDETYRLHLPGTTGLIVGVRM
jgi:(2Fe-2S) ferredoxin/predicted O-methyltransferase YrrM